MTRLLVLVFALAACGSQAQEGLLCQGHRCDAVPLANTEWVLHAPREQEPCGMSFDAPPELLGVTERAAQRWSDATGCDVRVEAGGVRMKAYTPMFVDYLPGGRVGISERPNPDGSSETPCGIAVWGDGVEIKVLAISLHHPACELEHTVVHEMGHALSGIRGHSGDGALASGDSEHKSGVITESSLALVCSGLPCAAFRPEH